MNRDSDRIGGIFGSLLLMLFTVGASFGTMVLLAPVLLTPFDSGTLTDRTPAFDWSDVPGASGYDLQVDTLSHFPAPLLDLALTTSTYTPSINLDAGQYYWRARARSATETSDWAATHSFRIITLAPTPFSPTNNAELTDRTPSFDWSNVPEATGYDFQLATDTLFSSPSLLADQTLITSQYSQESELSCGSYYWRARARINSDVSEWTATRHFTIVILPPTLLSPFNRSELTNRLPSFDWNDTPGATSYDYQLTPDSTFSTLMLDLSLASSAYSLSSELALNIKYYWRVRAWVSSDDVTPWTSAFSLTIVTPAPTLWFPANYSQTTDLTPTFDWSEPVGAAGYDLQVATTSNFSNLVIGLSLTPSTFTPSSDLYPGVYYWHVRIHPTTDSTRWSSTWQLTVIAVPQLLSFAINNGVATTAFTQVTLNNSVANLPEFFIASEDAAFTGASWLSYSSAPYFFLSSPAGTKTVYFKVKNDAGESNVLHDMIEFQPGTRVAGQWEEKTPEAFRVTAHPNPFMDKTTLVIAPKDGGMIDLDIHDLLGRRMRTLKATGGRPVYWDGRDDEHNLLPAGVYFVRVRDRALSICKVLFVRQ